MSPRPGRATRNAPPRPGHSTGALACRARRMPPGAGDGSRFDTGRQDVTELAGWMNPAEWSAARKAELDHAYEADTMAAKPVTYGGVQFRSTLEANWVRTLDGLSIRWQYEPWLYHAPSGQRYLPDLWLPDIRTFIEVKGLHMQRARKPQELAEGVKTDDIIVLLGFPPHRVSQSPYSWESKLKWHDPLGYDTRLAQCTECSGWQWMRAELSRHCRICGAFHAGVLAKPGEMPFRFVEPQRPAWMRRRLCHGSASTISTRFTAR